MRVVFAGTPEVALPSLDALLASPHEVVAVLTRPDAPAGRGRRLLPSPVKARALELSLPVLEPRSARDPGFHDALRELAPDACPVVAYGSLVPREALDIPVHGWVNLHFSLLPAWRGAAPVQHALMAGDELTGATTFVLEEGLDTGPVLGVMTERIRPDDTAGDLLGRLAQAGAGLLVASLDGLVSGQITPVPQATEGISLAPRLMVEDARIDWAQPAFAIDRRIRGCTPAPGAWTTARGERLKLGPVTVVGGGSQGAAVISPDGTVTREGGGLPGHLPSGARPGQVVASKRAVHVRALDGWVQLGTVRPHGRSDMAAADWARGIRIDEGEVLGG